MKPDGMFDIAVEDRMARIVRVFPCVRVGSKVVVVVTDLYRGSTVWFDRVTGERVRGNVAEYNPERTKHMRLPPGSLALANEVAGGRGREHTWNSGWKQSHYRQKKLREESREHEKG